MRKYGSETSTGCTYCHVSFFQGLFFELMNLYVSLAHIKKIILRGVFGSSSNDRNEFEADYWKDYRFLRNRRGVFVLKKYAFFLHYRVYQLVKQS